jgi:hypothetical protein
LRTVFTSAFDPKRTALDKIIGLASNSIAIGHIEKLVRLPLCDEKLAISDARAYIA